MIKQAAMTHLGVSHPHHKQYPWQTQFSQLARKIIQFWLFSGVTDHEQKCPAVPFQEVPYNSRGRLKLGKTPQLRIRGICVHQPSRTEKKPALNFVSTYPSFTSPKFLTFVIICLIIAHQPKLIINRV